MSIWSLMSQRIKPVCMLVSPGQPSICLASYFNLAMFGMEPVLGRCKIGSKLLSLGPIGGFLLQGLSSGQLLLPLLCLFLASLFSLLSEAFLLLTF